MRHLAKSNRGDGTAVPAGGTKSQAAKFWREQDYLVLTAHNFWLAGPSQHSGGSREQTGNAGYVWNPGIFRDPCRIDRGRGRRHDPDRAMRRTRRGLDPGIQLRHACLGHSEDQPDPDRLCAEKLADGRRGSLNRASRLDEELSQVWSDIASGDAGDALDLFEPFRRHSVRVPARHGTLIDIKLTGEIDKAHSAMLEEFGKAAHTGLVAQLSTNVNGHG